MLNKIALLVLISLSTASCSKRWCSAKYPITSSKDSIYIETVKEIPVYLPGDSILVDVPINCPDQDIINVETAKLKQQIKILNGKLVSNTIVKPDTVYIHTKETKTVVKEVKVPEPVKYIPARFKTYRNIVFFIAFILIAFISWKLYGFFKPKIKI